jgi:hypothetical protein
VVLLAAVAAAALLKAVVEALSAPMASASASARYLQLLLEIIL